MLLLSAVGAYYGTTLISVLLGGSYTVLTDPALLLMWALILIPVNLVGFALRRVAITNGLVAILLVSWMVYIALHGTGPAFTWLRQILAYGLLPTLNGICFVGLEKSYRTASRAQA